MEAVVICGSGGPEVLEYRKVDKPTPKLGFALIRVNAFGLNHAEMHMRKGEWDEWNPITGLECVGLVEACPGGEFEVGQKVAAVMGGMGRHFPGSYGEFVNAPVTNIIHIDSDLPWEELATLPEVYGTAWSCIHTILGVQAGEKVLIRGATSTIGQAALNLAVQAGARVTATTRRKERFAMLMGLGATEVKREQSELATQFSEGHSFDKVLNLIGNRVLIESIALTHRGGRMLQAGWLGGLEPVVDFNPMIQMRSGVHFSLFHSKVLGSDEFPMSSFPLQKVLEMIKRGDFSAKPVQVFGWKDIHAAHHLLDSGDAGGKIVIVH